MRYHNVHQSSLRPVAGDDATLKITVVYTGEHATRAAMERAALLAGDLCARLTLIYPQIVPYPRPVTSPTVPAEFVEERLRSIASQVPVDTDIRICLCRDREDALTAELQPQSVVVLGGRKRWWPTGEMRLAKKLRRAGHQVIFTETE